MQGITGAGKTTVARSLGEGLETLIISADDFFRRGRNFRFQGKRLPEAHEYCRQRFTRGLKSQPDLIVVDNTNLRPDHYAFYTQSAKTAGYDVILCRVLCAPEVAAQRSKHKNTISFDNLKKMARALEQMSPNHPFIEIRTDA